MRIAGLQKLTLLDYPGKTAATVFTPGCNFRCPFCHNADLVLGAPDAEDSGAAFPSYPADEFFAFLEKRHGLLDGVCITGGEPLLQSDLAGFCARVKELGFSVKLDTNGSFPRRLHALLDAGLVDYVAMDVKNAPDRYAETVGGRVNLEAVCASMDCLFSGNAAFEFRTTVVRELHTADDLHALACWIEGAPAWFLQGYVDEDGVLAGAGSFHPWEQADLEALLPALQQHVPAAALRGV